MRFNNLLTGKLETVVVMSPAGSGLEPTVAAERRDGTC